MLIEEQLLLSYGGVCVKYELDEEVFAEGMTSKYYFQIKTGVVELNNYNENGKKFTQHILFDGHSIGESFLIAIHHVLLTLLQKVSAKLLKFQNINFQVCLMKIQNFPS